MNSDLTAHGWEQMELATSDGSKIFRKDFANHHVDVLVPAEISSSTPLLVMHDGKNVFLDSQASFGNSWGVVDAVHNRQLKPVVIGVWGLINPEFPAIRMFELAPQKVLEENPNLWGQILQFINTEPHAAFSDDYHEMIATRILPQVAEGLGIEIARERTALAGSSMGGLTSLYGASLYPELYGTVLSLSTHWAFWDPEIIPALLRRISTAPRTRIWLDRGDLELDAQYEGLHEAAADYLREHGWQDGALLHAEVFYGTNHSEPVWRDRLPQVLNWWIGD